jgi:hypothetical protein
MSIKRATLNFIFIIPLYPHTPVCKPGRTLKQLLSGLLEFWECFALYAWLDLGRENSYDCFFGLFPACKALGCVCFFAPESEAL